MTNGIGESWTYYYDDKNRLTGIDGPEQYRIRYYYEGTLLSSIVQGNQIWKFRYNEEGDCIRIEEPSGQVTQRIYDAGHRVIAETHYQSFDGTTTRLIRKLPVIFMMNEGIYSLPWQQTVRSLKDVMMKTGNSSVRAAIYGQFMR